MGNKTLMESFPNLYRIVRKKGVIIANVLNRVPLNISFRRSLVGANRAAWLELVSEVAHVSLTERNDEFRWNLNKNGTYSVQSFYSILVQDGVLPRNSIVWKRKVPLKIKIFLWYLRSGVILTKDILAKRKWKGDTKCCFYNATETIQHLFFDCHVARYIWNTTFIAFRIEPPSNIANLFGSWLKDFPKELKCQILIGAAAICWAVWLWRNDVVFNRRPFNSFAQVVYRGTYWIRCWARLCKEEERRNLKIGCRHLEGVVLQLFSNFGWRRSYRIC